MSQNRTANQIRDLGLLDIAVMLTLNNANATETSLLDEAGMGALLRTAFYARGTYGGATAFLIALDHNAAYANPNFRWFKERHKSFVYIDRVIVGQASRGHGIGRKLYLDLFAAANQAGHDRVVCEVNVNPPNPASVAFHAAMGFIGIGDAAIHDGKKTVRYFEKLLE
jgi:predicted GNAT superfamily acetyltransferase